MGAKFWLGKPPSACQLCGDDLPEKFYDAKTIGGTWANTCQRCFETQTLRQLGLGRGQRYELNDDGHWEKTGG